MHAGAKQQAGWPQGIVQQYASGHAWATGANLSPAAPAGSNTLHCRWAACAQEPHALLLSPPSQGAAGLLLADRLSARS